MNKTFLSVPTICGLLLIALLIGNRLLLDREFRPGATEPATVFELEGDAELILDGSKVEGIIVVKDGGKITIKDTAPVVLEDIYVYKNGKLVPIEEALKNGPKFVFLNLPYGKLVLDIDRVTKVDKDGAWIKEKNLEQDACYFYKQFIMNWEEIAK